METPFYILLSIKTPGGFDAIGEYELGHDRNAAYELFESLQGDSWINDLAPLHLDLVETVETLPEKIRSKCCTLEQLSWNTRLIVREIFRQRSLDTSEM